MKTKPGELPQGSLLQGTHRQGQALRSASWLGRIGLHRCSCGFSTLPALSFPSVEQTHFTPSAGCAVCQHEAMSPSGLHVENTMDVVLDLSFLRNAKATFRQLLLPTTSHKTQMQNIKECLCGSRPARGKPTGTGGPVCRAANQQGFSPELRAGQQDLQPLWGQGLGSRWGWQAVILGLIIKAA